MDGLEKQMNELTKQEKENNQRLHSMRDHAIKKLQEVGASFSLCYVRLSRPGGNLPILGR